MAEEEKWGPLIGIILIVVAILILIIMTVLGFWKPAAEIAMEKIKWY